MINFNLDSTENILPQIACFTYQVTATAMRLTIALIEVVAGALFATIGTTLLSIGNILNWTTLPPIPLLMRVTLIPIGNMCSEAGKVLFYDGVELCDGWD